MKKIIKISFLIIILLVLSVFSSFLFKVRSIEINKNDCVQKNDINIEGEYIFTINSGEIEQNLRQKFFCIKNFSLDKKYPYKVVLTIEKYKPIVQIADTNLTASEIGQIEERKNENLPVVFFPKTLNLSHGSTISDGTLLFVLKIAALIQKTDFKASNIRIVNEKEIAVYEIDQSIAVFTTSKSPESQVDSLQQVTAIAKIDHDKIAKVDLRFDKPVITKE